MLAAPRTTDDFDTFWVEEGEDFQKAWLALRDGVQTIASKYTRSPNWGEWYEAVIKCKVAE